ncbi:MAG: PIG-L deacetylase family protein [bacterium]|nr:PIG-L deacetylase family protein [bacterium]
MKIIFVFAHPDDESFSSGGIIAKLTKEGNTVKLITATRGEAGQLGNPPITTKENLGKTREQELRKVAKILGISKIYFLDFKDGTLSKIPKKLLVDKIHSILQLEKPDVVVSFNKEGGSRHPDHMRISFSATEAFEKYLRSAKKHVRLYHSEIPKTLLKKLSQDGTDYKAFGKIMGTHLSKITTVVDISSTLDLKIKAIKCHKTQNKDWERYLKRMHYKEFKYEYFSLVSENNIK